MPIEFAVLKQNGVERLKPFKSADAKAKELCVFLDLPETQQEIRNRNVLGASSVRIQELVLTKAVELGFEDQEKGLFANYAVQALRPDYFCPIGDSGVLLEVERGKAIMNNMDLLDFWKCHICEYADYLFLVVPQARPSANGVVQRHFQYVQKRLGVFFKPKNYVNVKAVHLFGY